MSTSLTPRPHRGIELAPAKADYDFSGGQYGPQRVYAARADYRIESLVEANPKGTNVKIIG